MCTPADKVVILRDDAVAPVNDDKHDERLPVVSPWLHCNASAPLEPGFGGDLPSPYDDAPSEPPPQRSPEAMPVPTTSPTAEPEAVAVRIMDLTNVEVEDHGGDRRNNNATNIRKIVVFASIAITVLVVVIIALAVALTTSSSSSSSSSSSDSSTNSDGGGDDPGSIPSDPSSTTVPDPCESYGNVVVVSSSDGFCGTVLLEDTAYALSDDVVCDRGRGGPRLSNRTCLNCRGRSIRGDSYGRYDQKWGIEIPSTAWHAAAFNCAVEQFTSGVLLNGRNNRVANVEATNNYAGFNSQYGNNNTVSCSVAISNDRYGMWFSSTDYTCRGCLVEDNIEFGIRLHSDGIRLHSDGIVSCSEIRNTGRNGVSVWSGDNTVQILNTVIWSNDASNIAFDTGSSGVTTLSDVTMCDGGNSDMYIPGIKEYGWYSRVTLRTKNLTCDEIDNQSPYVATPRCDNPCHSSPFSSLPSVCSNVCPHGRGIV